MPKLPKLPKFDRDTAIALGLFCLVLLACLIAPALALKARGDAAEALADQQNLLARLEAAQQRAGKKSGPAETGTAPAQAFLAAPTPGLASAQLQTYLAQLAKAQQASVTSSGTQPASHADTPETVRVQASLDISYDALQPLLYQLETGTPYVFVDSMMLQPPSNATAPNPAAPMKLTLNLHALWHKAQE